MTATELPSKSIAWNAPGVWAVDNELLVDWN
jgi:hypothetical protein